MGRSLGSTLRVVLRCSFLTPIPAPSVACRLATFHEQIEAPIPSAPAYCRGVITARGVFKKSHACFLNFLPRCDCTNRIGSGHGAVHRRPRYSLGLDGRVADCDERVNCRAELAVPGDDAGNPRNSTRSTPVFQELRWSLEFRGAEEPFAEFSEPLSVLSKR